MGDEAAAKTKRPKKAGKKPGAAAVPGELLALDDLATRWGLSLDATKRVVRLRKVPHLDLGTADLRIVWGQVRFRPADIERWEGENLREFGDDEPEREPIRSTGRSGKDYWD